MIVARTAVTLLLGLGAIVSPAAATTALYASHTGPVYSGNSYTNFGTYHSNVYYVDANSVGSAYSGTWISNSSNARVSRDNYCSSPGCLVWIFWDSAKPSGYPTLHNHGNASPSYFDGAWEW